MSKLCSHCGFKNAKLRLNDREWTCPESNTHHNRDINSSLNIKKEGIKILKNNYIMIMNNDYAVGTTVKAFGEDLRLSLGEQFLMNYESTSSGEW